ncbi:PH domain-containing protein [Evansella sp. LMS18]|uniref:PH domain-containing protein n=1 Tax=Evansella sp. LMS18 TaxID=2924033 RepID=UPI0020D0C5FA|nr:PH domain-containing protein [Evansella sp. LMS18]UTR09681.1 PH domain-containing protein [Evansella sp. LMS18]
MNKWRRQHSAAIFIGFLSNLKEVFITMIAVLIFGQSSQAGGALFYTILFAGILIVSLVSGIIKWWTFRYQLLEDELQVRQGLIFRKKRYIRKERVQSIDINANLLQRLFELVELRIETAGGGGEPEFRLIALGKEEAAAIKRELLIKEHSPVSETDESETSAVLTEETETDSASETPAVMDDEIPETEEEEGTYKWKLSPQRLIAAALTSSGIGIAATFVAAIVSQVQQFIPPFLYERMIGWIIHSSVMLIGFWIVVILLIGWLITIIRTVLKYGYFTIRKKDDEIHISRGVLEQRQLTLSANKITAVRLVQNLLRQPFGYTAVYVESKGGGRKDEDLSTILIPLCKMKEVDTLLSDILPEYAVKREYSSLPKESLRRYMLRLLMPALAAAALITYFAPFGWISLFLPVVAAAYGYWQYIDAGIGNGSGMVWIRSRSVARSEVIVPRKRIQAMTSTQNILQKFDDLFTIHVSIITSIVGKTFSLKHIGKEQRDNQFQWYSYEETEEERKE